MHSEDGSTREKPHTATAGKPATSAAMPLANPSQFFLLLLVLGTVNVDHTRSAIFCNKHFSKMGPQTFQWHAKVSETVRH